MLRLVWIYLLRHGIAFDRADPKCPPDPQRPLTDKGVARTRAAAKGLRELGAEPDVILTSPYLRARQTADIVQDVAAGGVRVKRVAALVPDGDPAEVLEALSKYTRPMCVGHAPNLDEVAAWLLGCSTPPFALKKAGAAILRADKCKRGAASLHAFLPPAILRASAR